MKRFKILALMLALCLMAGSSTACSGGNDPVEISVNTTVTEATTASSEETSASAGSSETTETTESDTSSESSGTEETKETSETSASSETSESAETSEDTKATEPSEDTVVTEPSEDTKNTEPTEVGNDKIVYSGDDQKYVNTFITNFVESFFPNYDRDKEENVEKLLDFVHIHLKINSQKSIEYKKNGDLTFETFTFEKAQETVGKYFSYLLKEEDCKKFNEPPKAYGDQPAGPFYKDGRVWFEAADGESYNKIGIVDYADNNTDGTLTLHFTVYAIDIQTYWDLDDAGIRKYYKLSPDKAKKDKTLEKVGTGEAKVDVGQSGKYFLITYSTKGV
ncbi:MAG: hypothetical protein J5715_09835 [Clostridiales bacterium]|nr:hypothetical protein [Clostridiales bacterium]